MHSMRTILSFLCVAYVYAFSSDLENANHIFDSIQSAMKAWGSSVDHNGMSLFYAQIPKGTRLFHGDASTSPRKDVVFLAFEPEHALNFARPKRPRGPDGPGPGGPGGPGGPDDKGYKLIRTLLRFFRNMWKRFWGSTKRNDEDEWIGISGQNMSNYGWLHTYVASRDLRLIYLDGMSASKSDKGTLDFQDRILFNDTIEKDGMRDYDRLYALCSLAETDFEGRIDGMIRMELGFELNLCNPLSNLDLIDMDAVSQVEPEHDGHGKPGFNGMANDMRVFSSRYQGLGGNRVITNFDQFITAYNYSLDLFPEDSPLPRLNHIPAHDLEPIQHDIKSWVLTLNPEERRTDWQAIADMVVKRYGSSLKMMSRTPHLNDILEEAAHLLKPFIDASDTDDSSLFHRCAVQFIPDFQSPSLAADSIYTVSFRICSDLSVLSHAGSHRDAQKRLSDLLDYLRWPSWKLCEDCGSDEFCQIPIWPLGSQKDYDSPHCQKFAHAYENGNDYWRP